VNNLLAADETFNGPLLQFQQTAAVRDRLKDPQVKELNHNVYVRRAGARPQPLIAWSPVQNERGSVDIMAVEELRKLQPGFETQAKVFPDYRGPLFRGVELGNFELLGAFPAANGGAPLPPPVRDVLQWPAGQPVFPGAYAPQH
jgi:hypothetical protein